MKTNDLKKGTTVQLRNGWTARIEDNAKGNTRLCTVYGMYTEMGSVYSHDMVLYMDGGEWKRVEHTPAQEKLRVTAGSFGF